MRPAPPDRPAHRHSPPLPARTAAAARTQPELRRARIHHARADGLLRAPAGPLAAVQGQHQRARHLGAPARLGHRHPALPPPEPDPPGTDQLRDLTSQGYGPRKIACITGCSERTIRQLLASTGLRFLAPPPDGAIDPLWLRDKYQDHQRSLKDIATETGTPIEALAAAARKAGIRVRLGITGRAHPLGALGGPVAFPPDVWNVFTHPGAEQRIRRLLALPGQPGLHHAARQLGIRTAIFHQPGPPARDHRRHRPCCAPGQTDGSR